MLTFSAKSYNESDKARKLIESMLSTAAVKVDMVTVSGTDHQQQKIVQASMSHAQADGVKFIKDLSDQEDSESTVDLNSKSPQKKRVKHVNIEHIIMYTHTQSKTMLN